VRLHPADIDESSTYGVRRDAYCGTRAPLQRDHLMPISRGGREAIGNLVPAWGPRNNAKRNGTNTEFRLWLSKLGANRLHHFNPSLA
jgi:5-methylcytosine-specific restriction endonuclease McrA